MQLVYVISKYCFVANATGPPFRDGVLLLFKGGKGIESAAANGSNPCGTRLFRFVAIIPPGHTFATEAIRAGVDVETVSKTLGHFSVGFTLDVYGHVTQEMKEEAARRIQESINRRAMG